MPPRFDILDFYDSVHNNDQKGIAEEFEDKTEGDKTMSLDNWFNLLVHRMKFS